MKYIKNILALIIPPNGWQLAVRLTLAVFTGIIFFIIYEANTFSYFSDDAKTCVNCHVMYPQYATWMHSSHYRVAQCNDCHVPHDNIFREYYFHGADGLRHSTYFTMHWEPQVIQIKEVGRSVVQQNCIRCHSDLVDMTKLVEVTAQKDIDPKGKKCWDCHTNTPHGNISSLSSAPYALVPRLPSIVPNWMKSRKDTLERKIIKYKDKLK